MHVDIEKALPTVHADRDRLIQVMTNLLSNAIKFTDRGQIEVRAFKTQLARDCSASPPVEGLGQQLRYLDAGQWLAITVKDSGIGIAKEEFSQTFEKFRQVGDLDVLTGRPKGTGLGLPICKEIVEHHSGRIGVESEQGVGSTFAFVLPLAPETVEVVRPEVIGVPHAGSKPTALDIAESEPLILVVEDEDNIRNLLHQILNEAGYPMIEAADGMQALKQARHMHPDLIICDIMIPGISGFDVVSVLKGDPQTSDIPILILSVVEDRERGFRLGADAYLNKPVDTEQLLASITRLLSHDAPDHKRALIIGEDKAFAEKNRPRLRAHGYEVAFALDLHEGLALMQQDETTLLVLDEAVARLNDYGMLKVLKTKRAFHNVKVTVLLPSASSEAITEMRRQGADWCGVPEDLEYYLQEVQVLEKGGGNA